MKNRESLKMRKIACAFASIFVLAGLLSSCSDDKNKIPEYNSKEPIVLDNFYPKSGSMMEGIIISGSNFGNDPKKIKVYFNKKKAIVTGVSGDKIQALAPRLPGDICDISVVIGSDSVVFNDKYEYIKSYNLSILCGQANSSTTSFVEGTLSQTEFLSSLHFLTIDPQDILYVSMSGDGQPIVYINEEQGFSKTVLYSGGSGTTRGPMGGTFVPGEKKLAIMSANRGYFWEIDPYNPVDYNERKLLSPTTEQIANGYVKPTNAIEWFYSCVYTEYTRPGDPLASADEGFLYTRTYNGMLMRFRMSNRVMDMVTHQCPTGAGDTYIIGDPDDNTKIYCSTKQNHRISVIDLTKTPSDPDFEKTIVGLPGTGDHIDGHVSVAKLNSPQQIVVTKDIESGNKIMYIADTNNSCIRKYDFETEMVSTIAGTPKVKGLVMGSPTQSKMGNPYGLAVNSQGDLYISDRANRVILKLSFQ